MSDRGVTDETKRDLVPQKGPGPFCITEISRKTGLTHRQIYYWESVGLLKPQTIQSGRRQFRRYGERELERLFEIKAWLEVGYTLEAVRKMQMELQVPGTSEKVPGTYGSL